MKHGDLSNRTAPVIGVAVRCLYTVAEPRPVGFVNFVRSLLPDRNSDKLDYKVNRTALARYNRVFFSTDWSFYLYAFNDEDYFVAEAFEFPCTRIEMAEKDPVKFREQLRADRVMYYFDVDKELLSVVDNAFTRALPFEELTSTLGM